MARLTESQLAGFRTGGDAPVESRPRGRPNEPALEPLTQEPGADQPSLALGSTVSTPSALGPVPSAPARSDARQKVGLTLPVELAEAVRGVTSQGYALADLVMVAYQQHRGELVSERQEATARKLQRRTVGRSSFTITLSTTEREALDALAHLLDTTRSYTVAALLERHLSNQQLDPAPAADPTEKRSLA